MINFFVEGYVNLMFGMVKVFLDWGDIVYYIMVECFKECFENVGVIVYIYWDLLSGVFIKFEIF